MAPFLPTFGGAGSPQVINGSQDEPQGLLLLAGHPQDLHGGLEFGELLRCSLLLLGLRRSKVKCRQDARGSVWEQLTFEGGRIPKALLSARWLKCSSVLRGQDVETRQVCARGGFPPPAPPPALT